MTGYDVFAIVVILFSVAAGWVRGGVREVITLLSATLAALVALIALPWTAGVTRAFVDPEWAGSILAAVLTFFVVYFGLRLVGSMMSKSAKDHPHLGVIDRIFGLFIGGMIPYLFGAMAMEPLGHIAGTASSVQGFVTTVGGALVGFAVGQQFDGTTVPLMLGFAICGVLSLVLVLVAEGGRLFRPHHAR